MYFQGITKLSEFTIIFTHIFKVSQIWIVQLLQYNFQTFSRYHKTIWIVPLLHYNFQTYFQGITKLSEFVQLLQFNFQKYFQGITKLSELFSCCTTIFRHIFNLHIFPTLFQCIWNFQMLNVTLSMKKCSSSDTFSHNTVSVKIIFEQKYNFQAFCCSSAGRVQIPIQKQENMQVNVTNMKGAFSHLTGWLAGLPGQNWLNAHEQDGNRTSQYGVRAAVGHLPDIPQSNPLF